MNPPDWKDAPEWANWLAMDSTGRWYWYQCEPKAGPKQFASDGKLSPAETRGNWQATKEHRPVQP